MKKIIFDLDDTLYIDPSLRGKREEAILEFLGDRRSKYFKLKDEGRGTIESFKLLGLSREDFFKVIGGVEINIKYDKVLIEVLEKLKKDYKLYILSNSPKKVVYETLQKLGVFYLIDEIYYGEYFQNEKPDPACFFMVEIGDIAVGNSFKKDLEIPKGLGAITIIIGKENTPADYAIKTIYEISDTIKKT